MKTGCRVPKTIGPWRYPLRAGKSLPAMLRSSRGTGRAEIARKQNERAARERTRGFIRDLETTKTKRIKIASPGDLARMLSQRMRRV